MLPLSYSTTALENLTPEAASNIRDAEWEQQEEKFHDAAIREANDAIRRYNTVAPYVVRRSLLTRQSEMARCYASSGGLIVAGIQERMISGGQSPGGEEAVGLGNRPADIGWGMFSNAVRRLYARFASMVKQHMY
jgi:DnaJ family protein C protein 28